MTTIALPSEALGQIAAAQVLAALAGEPIARQSLLPFELLARGTTARLAVKKPTSQVGRGYDSYPTLTTGAAHGTDGLPQETVH